MSLDDNRKFADELLRLCKKHKISTFMGVFHPPLTPANRMAPIVVGAPTLEWCKGAGEIMWKHIQNGEAAGVIRHDPQFGPTIADSGGIMDLSKLSKNVIDLDKHRQNHKP